MPRRSPYTQVGKTNQIRAAHVQGAGDKVFKGFQCLNPDCKYFIIVPKAEVEKELYEVTCPACDFLHSAGMETRMFDYEVVDKRDQSIMETGAFTISHDDYIQEADEYKYCILCNVMKPLHMFDKHSARSSGRQGECRLCKGHYNAIKNKTRTTDQHRESGQRRRLYGLLAGSHKIDSDEIAKRFRYRCFRCDKSLKDVTPKERPLDHTLPVAYLWPLTTKTATLLCNDCNGEKADKWPGQFYTRDQLKQLSVLTGISYELLEGPPCINPDALIRLQIPEAVDQLLTDFAPYKDELLSLRNRVMTRTGLDIFAVSRMVNTDWVREADALLYV